MIEKERQNDRKNNRIEKERQIDDRMIQYDRPIENNRMIEKQHNDRKRQTSDRKKQQNDRTTENE